MAMSAPEPAVRSRTVPLGRRSIHLSELGEGRSLQRRMPCRDLYLFSRTGHWVQWERADEFNAAVPAFLSQDPLTEETA